jgi:N-acetylmuramoyl-L-alanine amidase-like protein
MPAVQRVGLLGGAAKALSSGEGPVTYRSRVIDAPHRFDLVGIAGELRPLEFRARSDGGEWSRWVETANGDPVYTGGSDEVQVRTRGWRPTGRLHYVNVSGTMNTADTLLNGARKAINGAFISLAGAVEPAAAAGPPRPDMISRQEWGANREHGGCHRRAAPAYRKVKAGVVHHTVTTSGYSEQEAPSIVLGICRYHRNANGWNDIGYNALVDRFGNIYVGRSGGIGKAVVGAQAQGFNTQTTGVASIGTHTHNSIRSAEMRGFARFLAWKLARHGLPAKGHTTLVSGGGRFNRWPRGERVRTKRIIGHRHLGATECPGRALNNQLSSLRDRTQRRIDNYASR